MYQGATRKGLSPETRLGATPESGLDCLTCAEVTRQGCRVIACPPPFVADHLPARTLGEHAQRERECGFALESVNKGNMALLRGAVGRALSFKGS